MQCKMLRPQRMVKPLNRRSQGPGCLHDTELSPQLFNDHQRSDITQKENLTVTYRDQRLLVTSVRLSWLTQPPLKYIRVSLHVGKKGSGQGRRWGGKGRGVVIKWCQGSLWWWRRSASWLCQFQCLGCWHCTTVIQDVATTGGNWVKGTQDPSVVSVTLTHKHTIISKVKVVKRTLKDYTVNMEKY